MSRLQLDEIDRRVLRLLIQDASRTNRDLSRAVGISESACLARVRRLEESGAISGYTAILGPAAHPHAGQAILEITLHDDIKARARFRALLRGHPQVYAAYQTARDNSYLVKVGVDDCDHIDEFAETISAEGLIAEPTRRWLILRSMLQQDAI
ncbi:MAG TPA: Lrp/AsnC family transcriptional regulator [Verrucomicrobiae bacterium]|jgi:DNA-binding Lrp family transcriptional regulator|nr:Lrp/AsnC family transcriptional regulator [Verrucomicrobiae bacterium]